MSHNRADSLDSTASPSSPTSISSRTSIETYRSLKDDITNIQHSQTDLQQLVHEAEKLIQDKFMPNPQHIYTYRKGDDTISVSLDRVMNAMLANAEECGGGEDAKRYAASAIVACGRREDVVGTLAALGVTWLTHFLFVFKTGRGQPNQEPRELATPTLHTTASHVGVREGVGHGIGSFPDDVKERDGYKCILSGYSDLSRPAPDENIPGVYLKACHILHRTIGQCKNDHDPKSDSFMSSTTTLDILANYTRLPIEDLENHLDSPSNGISLGSDAHDAFAMFDWCLKATSKENVYTVKVFNKRPAILHGRAGASVIFKDQSNNYTPPSGSGSGSGSRKRARTIPIPIPIPIPLPNPRYLAIHAAIAGILHTSAAGKFFDGLLDLLHKDGEGNIPPVRSWSELEKLMEEGVLRDFVQSLQLVGVR